MWIHTTQRCSDDAYNEAATNAPLLLLTKMHISRVARGKLLNTSFLSWRWYEDNLLAARSEQDCLYPHDGQLTIITHKKLFPRRIIYGLAIFPDSYQWSSSSYNLMVFSRCSTSATPCTTTMASWSAWTSTASCAEKELSLTSRPWPATIQRMLSLARNHQVCMELSSSGKSPKIIKENLPWILTQKNCQFPKVWFQDNPVCAELDE